MTRFKRLNGVTAWFHTLQRPWTQPGNSGSKQQLDSASQNPTKRTNLAKHSTCQLMWGFDSLIVKQLFVDKCIIIQRHASTIKNIHESTLLLWFRHRPCAVRTRVIGRSAPSMDLIGQKTVRRLTLTSGIPQEK